MRTGTHHFVSRSAAQRYYGAYGFSIADVTAKIAAKEIAIGKPPLKAGQRLSLIDEGARYAVEEGQP